MDRLHHATRGFGRRLCAGALAFGLGITTALADEPVFELVTRDEAALAHLAEEAGLVTEEEPTLRANAPRIVVQAPTLNATIDSPVDIRVEFVPVAGANIRFETLRVRYRAGPIWADVTGRIAPHATLRGNVLTARGASLPSGRHTLRVDITDTANRTGSQVFSFAVN